MKISITLRLLKVEDAESLVKYANNKKIFDNMRDAFPHPYTIVDAANYIKICNEISDSKIIYGIEYENEIIGCIGGFVDEDIYIKTCELGYWIGEPFWGRGITTEAIQLMTEKLFKRFDIVRLYAEPYENNIGSRKALEKAGFKLESLKEKSVFKNGEIQNSCIYVVIR